MNEDPKYWEETVLPWIKELKAKQEEARLKLLELEAAAYSKAGYTKKCGRYIPNCPKVGIIKSSELGNNWSARYHLLKQR
jgi:hypothetical protein